MSEKETNNNALIAEYSATNDAYMHYDNFSWQVGSILIAGVFVFWGFLSNSAVDKNLIIGSSILVSILMSAWLLYTAHNRQIYLCKLHRLYEIEEILGLKQHLRWKKGKSDGEPYYRTFGFSGHALNGIIYTITSLGAPFLAYIQDKKSYALLIPILIVTVVLLWSRSNEKLLMEKLESL